jgi:hypothetical protein
MDSTMPIPAKAEPVDNELALRLGQIVIHWSTLESWMSMLLATLIKADLGGFVVVSNNIAIATQTKLIRAIVAGRPDQEIDASELRQLLEWADDTRAERNELVHGAWATHNCEPKTALVQRST